MSETEQTIKVRVEYTKTGMSRYIAHLDNIDIMTKALRRLKLPYVVSQGFHVRPELSFAPPLPLGHASLCEYFVMTLTHPINPEKIKKQLSEQLPIGMEVTKVIQPWIEKKAANIGERVTYKLYFTNNEVAETTLKWISNPQTTFEGNHKGKTKTYSIGKAIQTAQINKENDEYVITAVFEQGMEGVPSVSKIITALSEYLGDKRETLRLIERVALVEL